MQSDIALGQILIRLVRDDGNPDTPPNSPLNPVNLPASTFRFEPIDFYDPVPFECQVDAGAWVPCASPLVVGPLPDGTHTFAARVPGHPSTSTSWDIGEP